MKPKKEIKKRKIKAPKDRGEIDKRDFMSLLIKAVKKN